MDYKALYQSKLTTAQEAVKAVKSGDWVDYTWCTNHPVALDKACVDLVYASDDPGKVHLIERIESRHGTHTLDHAAAIGLGDPDYELIDIDN